MASRDWFVGAAATIADVALFAYTQWAHEGGFDLTRRPAVRSWLGRCADAFGPGRNEDIAAAAGR